MLPVCTVIPYTSSAFVVEEKARRTGIILSGCNPAETGLLQRRNLLVTCASASSSLRTSRSPLPSFRPFVALRQCVPVPLPPRGLFPDSLQRRLRLPVLIPQKLSFKSRAKCGKCSAGGVTFATGCKPPFQGFGLRLPGEINLHPPAYYTEEFTSLMKGQTQNPAAEIPSCRLPLTGRGRKQAELAGPNRPSGSPSVQPDRRKCRVPAASHIHPLPLGPGSQSIAANGECIPEKQQAVPARCD